MSREVHPPIVATVEIASLKQVWPDSETLFVQAQPLDHPPPSRQQHVSRPYPVEKGGGGRGEVGRRRDALMIVHSY